MTILQVIFWTGIFLVVYTYLIFPFILQILKGLGFGKKKGDNTYSKEAPLLSVLIAAYNEEKVIREKLRSVLNTDYPAEKLEILVGSDASSDGTNEIVEAMSKEHGNIRFFPFDHRTGKPGIINSLVKESRGEILVITDANVMLEAQTLVQLAAPFAREDVGLVDSRMINTQLKKDGISHQEKFYISREVGVKRLESEIWGSMMGPFGGCYAVRRECYVPVPRHFLVDDFFINMSVLGQGRKCISNIEARVYEDVSNDLKEEYRRKKRISAGNFQNLLRFSSLLLFRKRGISFCFLSHKVLRWLTPFIAVLTIISSTILGFAHPDSLMNRIYIFMAFLQYLTLLIPVIDHFLRKIKIQSLPLRFISHFVLMNLALMAGFFQYIGGIKSNVWEPTRRNQGEAQ